MDLIKNKVKNRLDSMGCKVDYVKIERLDLLRNEILDRYQDGSLDKALYERYFKGFNFNFAEELKNAKSVLIVAIPQETTKLKLSWKNKSIEVVVPPTYIRNEVAKCMPEELTRLFNEEGYTICHSAKIPFKLLSAKSGLSSYGKNNIAYVTDMGSFITLQAYYTDYDCGEDNWGQAKMMSSCETCKLCEFNCPTGCITQDRFLIHAENCLTHFNEDKEQFPEWIDDKWHNALVGCMKCQIICPHNKNHIKETVLENVFDEEEIELMSNNAGVDKLSMKTIENLKKLDLFDMYEDHTLSRNLRVLLHQEI